ncbi:MAG: argininosuccinate lyase [Eubacteriales bacterium]|jgi:argininosuccinate lyase|nr:argininosuccinate lyase [Eubacteriales bacterium]MDD4104462.1 argininosuccinate lyase [Eubacteriales bacterium]MDD4709824.1 argininosuccinate lyase [Eubacteriales bacterium]NLO15130.1 argininosuccinate lyase [Clostridiales bacterium]
MKLWGGRFQRDTEKTVDDFQSSLPFDKRLYRQDIRASLAHAAMLGKQGIISDDEMKAILNGLAEILLNFEKGAIDAAGDAEDIHMLVEELLTERIGEAGKKLHTGRSRNDQVALDMRLYAMKTCDETADKLKALCETLLSLAQKHAGDIMPGYTHLQRAQPITLGHWFLCWFEMHLRDLERVRHAKDAADNMPLGAGALAGTTYSLDRDFVRVGLKMSALCRNSLDAVSDRDFLLDYLHAASVGMMHLSRLCEELVLWNTTEFGFITLDDRYATGSSMMPQKKNPDVAELIRGKTGRVYGDLMALMTVMKGLPLAYGKDMQEDKESFFDARDTYTACLDIIRPLLETGTFHTDIMHKGALNGFTNATDLADYLVGKGTPFRDAHAISGQVVAYCLGKGCALHDLSLKEFRRFANVTDEDVYEAIALENCINRRKVLGGPATGNVLKEVELGKVRLRAY